MMLELKLILDYLIFFQFPQLSIGLYVATLVLNISKRLYINIIIERILY